MPAIVPIIVAGISAASSAYAAHKASEASKQAAQTQANASTQAAQSSQQTTRDVLDYLQTMRQQGQPQSSPAYAYLQYLSGIPGAQKPGTGASLGGGNGDTARYAQMFGNRTLQRQ